MASLEERVVARLREEKVKLWLAPYDDDGALTATASTYAAALDEADVAAVAATLRDLRRRAVEKLAAKRRRTVRGAGAAGEPLEVALTAHAGRRRAVLAAAGGYDGRVRVIAGGRALPGGAAVDEPSEVDRLLDACDRLARDRAFDISDGRSGRRVRVPPARRAAQAAALHARGKRCGDAAAAIDFFLAADEAFDRVRAAAPALVDEVDNFGFLQLDLCRAYALLGDGARLDDAERRLAAAERSWPVLRHVARRGADVGARRGRRVPAGGAPPRRRGPGAAGGAGRVARRRRGAAARRGRRAKAAAAILDAADRRGAKRKAPIVAGGGATSDGSFVDARALDRSAASAPSRSARSRRSNGATTTGAPRRRTCGGPPPVDAAKLAALLELGADRAPPMRRPRLRRRRRPRGHPPRVGLEAAAGRDAGAGAGPVPAPPLPPPPPRGPRPPMDAELEAAHRLVEAELGGALEDEDADAIDGADLAYETALLESLRS
ncbi:hypothetical protein JL721_8421 [Aureococcus anophagefferens]|nr:hypothetical protein JL721_8421 [Aureococcus anophagefferens]